MSFGDPFAQIPAPRAACIATVVIPARDEAVRIGRTLDALADQREPDGSRLPPGCFDVLVYANNCNDETAAEVRAAARRHPEHGIYVAEEHLPPNVAHIGTARRSAMNAASARFAAAGITNALLAATDADTIPAPTWLTWIMNEMGNADVVTGRIMLDPAEWRALPPAVRSLLREEDIYQFALAQLESQLAPRECDPWPRHWQRSGPSLAVHLEAYDAVGGVPPVRTLEDVALYDALKRRGARIRHSLRVRVMTSARFNSRAAGGFGERIRIWNQEAGTNRSLLVEDPAITIARLRGEYVTAGEAELVRAVEATAALRQAIAGGSAASATRRTVASIAG